MHAFRGKSWKPCRVQGSKYVVWCIGEGVVGGGMTWQPAAVSGQVCVFVGCKFISGREERKCNKLMAKRPASFKVEGSGTGRTLWALQSVSAAASVQQLDMCQTPGCPPMCSFSPSACLSHFWPNFTTLQQQEVEEELCSASPLQPL